MKLGKCKQALAKLINENGGWVDGEAIFAAMDGNGDLFGYSGRPQWTVSHGHWYGHTLTCWFFSPIVINNHHQTILSREEYYQAYPMTDDDGWIEWKCGECPVDGESIVDVEFNSGNIVSGVAKGLSWRHEWKYSNVIAYRPHKPDVKPELCESVMRSIPEPEFDDAGSRLAKALELVKSAAPHMLRDKYKFDGNEVMGERKPTIEQLAQDYRNAKDYEERLQKEADEAKAAADAALGELERAGEAIGLLIGVAKPEQELEITDWRDLMVGDEVECTEYDPAHRFGVVCRIDESSEEQPIMVNHGDGKGISWPSSWKFIRRP